MPDRTERDQRVDLEAGRAGPGDDLAERVEAAVDGDALRRRLAAVEVEGVAAAPHLHVQHVGVHGAGACDRQRDLVGRADPGVERVDEDGAPAWGGVLGVRGRGDRAHHQDRREQTADELGELAVMCPGRVECTRTLMRW